MTTPSSTRIAASLGLLATVVLLHVSVTNLALFAVFSVMAILAWGSFGQEFARKPTTAAGDQDWPAAAVADWFEHSSPEFAPSSSANDELAQLQAEVAALEQQYDQDVSRLGIDAKTSR